MRLSADRLTAARLLIRIEGGAFSSRLMASATEKSVRVRVLEVLRWQRTLDAILDRWCRKRVDQLDPEVRAALRIGLAEVMRLDTPPALATDGAIHLVRRLGRSSASGMVNAVLRKAAAGWRDGLENAPPDLRYAHPEWLFVRWSEHFGRQKATDAMKASQEPAVTWVWFTRGHVEDAKNDGLELEAHPWMPGAWTAPGRAGELVKMVREGTAYAQDPSSQIVAWTAARLSPRDGRIADLCAAPGGKTALCAVDGRAGLIVGADRSLTRTRLMAGNLERVGLRTVIVADALSPPLAERAWDLVLLDAPCSGSGTLRRHPELKWRLQVQSLSEMALKQRALYDAAAPLVAPGGILMYSTCSVEPEENEGVVADLPEGFERSELSSVLPEGTPWIETPEGGCRILPNPYGDGFTMHAVRRSR